MNLNESSTGVKWVIKVSMTRNISHLPTSWRSRVGRLNMEIFFVVFQQEGPLLTSISCSWNALVKKRTSCEPQSLSPGVLQCPWLHLWVLPEDTCWRGCSSLLEKTAPHKTETLNQQPAPTARCYVINNAFLDLPAQLTLRLEGAMQTTLSEACRDSNSQSTAVRN